MCYKTCLDYSLNRREMQICSFGVNLAELGGSVGQSDVELTGTSDDVLSFAGRDVLCNLGAMGPVVHEKQFHV